MVAVDLVTAYGPATSGATGFAMGPSGVAASIRVVGASLSTAASTLVFLLVEPQLALAYAMLQSRAERNGALSNGRIVEFNTGARYHVACGFQVRKNTACRRPNVICLTRFVRATLRRGEIKDFLQRPRGVDVCDYCDGGTRAIAYFRILVADLVHGVA